MSDVQTSEERRGEAEGVIIYGQVCRDQQESKFLRLSNRI